MIIWGISWPVSKIIANELNYEMLIFIRFCSTSILYFPFLIFKKESLKLNKKSFMYILLGTITISMYNLFFFAGLKKGFPGLGGVLTTGMNPIFNFVIVAILTKTKIPFFKSIGLGIGFIGGMILLQIWNLELNEIFKEGNSYFLLGSITWVFLSMTTSKSKDSISTFTYSFYIHIFSSILFLALLDPNEFKNVPNLSSSFWICLFYLSGISTVFGTTMYFLASTKLGSAQASSFIFIVPTSALLSSWILLSETPKPTTIFGGLLLIIAVFILNKK